MDCLQQNNRKVFFEWLLKAAIFFVIWAVSNYNFVTQVSFMRAATSHVTHMPATWTQLVEETRVLVGLWAPTITVWIVTEVAECPGVWILTWGRELSSYKVILPIHPCLVSPASKWLPDFLPVHSEKQEDVWFVYRSFIIWRFFMPISGICCWITCLLCFTDSSAASFHIFHCTWCTVYVECQLR